MSDNKSQWNDKTVSELKHELRSRGLSVGGRKAELVGRLITSGDGVAVIEAELVEDITDSSTVDLIGSLVSNSITRIRGLPVATLAVAGIMVFGATGGPYSTGMIS